MPARPLIFVFFLGVRFSFGGRIALADGNTDCDDIAVPTM
jgi:hypothetical protein